MINSIERKFDLTAGFRLLPPEGACQGEENSANPLPSARAGTRAGQNGRMHACFRQHRAVGHDRVTSN